MFNCANEICTSVGTVDGCAIAPPQCITYSAPFTNSIQSSNLVKSIFSTTSIPVLSICKGDLNVWVLTLAPLFCNSNKKLQLHFYLLKNFP